MIFISDGDRMDERRRLPLLLFRLNPEIVVLHADMPSSSTIRVEFMPAGDGDGDDDVLSFLRVPKGVNDGT